MPARPINAVHLGLCQVAVAARCVNTTTLQEMANAYSSRCGLNQSRGRGRRWGKLL